MFKLTLEGKSQLEVARIFNQNAYTTGMFYYKTGRIYREDGDPELSKGTISKMLNNRAYTGTFVQGVKQQNLVKVMKQKFVDKNDHIIFENAHEPIKSKEDFEKVLERRK